MGYSTLSKYRAELMGLAMLWVMLFHASDLNMGSAPLEFIRGAGFGGVDVFILLSAMGLTLSLSMRERDDLAFMARRADRILPSYYIVMLPYTLFLILTQGKYWASLLWNSTLLYYWLRSSGAFNWYVAGIMTFYALAPWCFRRLNRSRHRVGLTAAWVALGLALCQLLTHEGYWYVMDFFYRVPVFALGLLLGFFVRDGRRLGAKDLLFWSCAAALGGGYLYINLTKPWIGWPVHFPLCHLFLLTGVPLCLAACVCFEKLPLGALRRFLRLVGENSLEIYLLNVSLFSQTALLRRLISFGPSNRLYYLVMFSANLALGWLLHKGVALLRERWKKRADKRELSRA